MNISRDTKLKVWLSILVTFCTSVIIASLIFPIRIFQNIIWKYFWGPVVADAYGQSVVTRSSESVNLNPNPPFEGVVAEPGYTLTSTVVYALILMFMLYGIMIFISRIDLDFDIDMALSLVPFMILGGILRIVEDINTTLYTDFGRFIIPYPFSTLLISPLIYLTVFVLVLFLIFASRSLKSRNIIEKSNRFLLYSGFTTVLLTTLWIAYVNATTDISSASLIFALVSLLISTSLALLLYYGIERFKPEYNQGTEALGFVLIWAHTLDGVVNVLSLDWSSQLGVSVRYRPKHVFNTLIRNITETFQPEALTKLVGITWPFIIVKITIALFLIWSFDKEFRDENPYLFISLILGAIAVGLGPGSRDLIRATLGI